MKKLLAAISFLFYATFSFAGNVVLVNYENIDSTFYDIILEEANKSFGKFATESLGKDSGVYLSVFYTIDYDSAICIASVTSTIGSYKNGVLSISNKFIPTSTTIRIKTIKSENQCYELIGLTFNENFRELKRGFKTIKGN